MASLNLVITPVLEKGSVEALQKELSRIGSFKINVDTNGAQATQRLASGLKSAATNAEALADGYDKVSRTYRVMQDGSREFIRVEKEATDEHGRRIRVIASEKAEEKGYTVQVIDDAKARAKEAKKAEQERLRAEKEAQRERQALIRAERAEEDRQDRERAKAQEAFARQKRSIMAAERRLDEQESAELERQKLAQAEASNRQIVVDEQDAQRERSTQWKAYFEHLNALTVESEREEEASRKRKKAIWQAFIAEQEAYEKGKEALEELRVKQAEATNRQMVIDEQDALRQRHDQWQAYFDQLNAQIEASTRTSQQLRASYSALIEQIQRDAERHPDMGYEELAREATALRSGLEELNPSTQEYVDNVNRAGTALNNLRARYAELSQAMAPLERQMDREAKAEREAEAAHQRAERQIDTLRVGYGNLLRQIDKLKAIYPAGTFDEIEQQARQASAEVNNLDVNSENLAVTVERLSQELKRLKGDISTVRANTKELEKNTESLWMNFKKFMRWYLLGNIGVKFINGFREALSVMKEVDQELAQIQKVTDRTAEQMQTLADSAYSVASSYGVEATAYLESVAAFAKAGYDDQAESLAELAIKAQLVGDINAETANKFLIASDAAWKYGGDVEKLSQILDAANVVENNFATTIQKISDGLPLVASIAANAGMSMEQTIAALGTITSVTQESGAMAARALRALILNIIGEVGEFDDGIEVTEESIKSLSDVLELYAEDAVDAAREAGRVINPMEAIAALAKASEEGVLDQAELFELLSGLGGKLRTNQLQALVTNTEMTAQMLDMMAQSAGSADKEITILLDTWDAKTKILKNTWTEFVNGSINSGLIKWLIDAATALVKFADNAGYAALAVGGLYAVFKAKSVVSGFSDAISSLRKVITGVATAAETATLTVGAFVAALGIVLMVVNSVNEARKESEAAAVSEGKKLADLYDSYEAIADKMRDESTDRDTLNGFIESSVSRYSEEFKAISDINDARERGIELIQEEAQERAREYMREHGADYRRAYDYLNSNSSVDLGGGYYVGAQAGLDILSGQIDALNAKDKLNAFEQANLENLQKRYTTLKATVEQYQEIVRLYEQAEAIANGTYVSPSHTTGGGTGATDPTEPFAAETKSVQNLVDLLEEAKQLGLDLSQTVFGNIDTNNRAVLEWTEENLKKYKTELESWGYEVGDLMGSISTVMGTSSEYNGIEIAFSPILQTDSGPVLLSRETVDKYISALFDAAGPNWSASDLLSLDWSGLEIDGTKIKGLLADIGDTAIQTGEVMHYAGKNGALALAGFKGYASDVATELKRVSDRATAMDTAISGVTDALDKYGANSYEVYDAMRELEKAIPGSTAKLYDFATGALLVDTALVSDKDSLIDLIDASAQTKFDSLINEMERASEAALTMAASIAMALPGGYNEQFLEPYRLENNPALTKLKQQKADWDAYISALRARTTSPTTTSSSKSSADPELDRLKGIVSLRKSELSLLEASGAAEEDILAKRKEIQAALHDQAEYMRGILATMKEQGATQAEIDAYQAEINALSTEWWSIQKDIQDLQDEQLKKQQEIFETLKKTIDEYYDKVVSDKEKELTLEEKILEVQKAQAALANAQAERTVRYYNAATGQWEWGADANAVKSAQEALKSAQDALSEYNEEQAWEAFKTAWEKVAEQITAGEITFKEAYDYMYKAMRDIQDQYGVDLAPVLEDSIGGFRDLAGDINSLDEETAKSLASSVGLLKAQLDNYGGAVSALQTAFTSAASAVANGETTIDGALATLKAQAEQISKKYGVDMTTALNAAINGMDKTTMSIDDLWKQVVIMLMQANSVQWHTASDTEKVRLHAENEMLAKLIGAEYDPDGYWYVNNKTNRLYDPNNPSAGVESAGAGGSVGGGAAASGTASTTGGTAAPYYGQSLYGIPYPKSEADEENYDWEGFYNAVLNAALENGDYAVAKLLARQMREGVSTRHYYTDPATGKILYTESMVPLYDGGGVLSGVGGIKATTADELVLPPDITAKMLDPVNNNYTQIAFDALRWMMGDGRLPSSVTNNRIGSQHNGNIYQIGGITVSEERARSTSVYDLAQMARGLGSYRRGN